MELTCAATSDAPWAFAGDSAGRVHAFPRVETSAADDAKAAWSIDACAAAVTSLCVLEDPGQAEPLVVVGSADGELVFLRGGLELRRFRLAAAVRCVAHVRSGEFLVGDQLGALYSATRHEMRWKETLPDSKSALQEPLPLFPGAGKPTVTGVVPVKLLDVQNVESSYALVAAGQKALLLTHRGRVFATIRSPSPLTTIARWQPVEGDGPAEDLVLAAGEEGVVYRLASKRGTSSSSSTPERPDFQLVLEPWASVAFPIAKLLVVSGPKAGGDDPAAALTWLNIGVYGQIALFRGQDLVKQCGLAGSTDCCNLLVDALLLSIPDDHQPDSVTVGLVFPDGIRRVKLKT